MAQRKAVMDVDPCGTTEAHLYIKELVAELWNGKVKDLDLPLEKIMYQGLDSVPLAKKVNQTLTDAGHSGYRSLLILGVTASIKGSKITNIINSMGTSSDLKIYLSKMTNNLIQEGRSTNKLTVILPRLLAIAAPSVILMHHEDDLDTSTNKTNEPQRVKQVKSTKKHVSDSYKSLKIQSIVTTTERLYAAEPKILKNIQ